MNINPFETVKNYSEMLNKIAVFNFFSGLLFFFLMGKLEPKINSFLSTYDWNIELIGKNFSIINIVIPFTVTIFSRIIKLHDRISDIFKIRAVYDVNFILMRMANLIAYQTPNLKNKLRMNRNLLMRKCFYKYASTQESKCDIDYHNVMMAMDQFCWYWIIIEIIFVAILALIVSILFKSELLVIILLITVVVLVLMSFFVLSLCKKYTSVEVEQILEDSNRVNEIKNQYNAL